MQASLYCLRVRKPAVISPPIISSFLDSLLAFANGVPNYTIASYRLFSHYHAHYTPFSVTPKISTALKDVSPDASTARSNYLITTLARDGKLADARRLFDETPQRDVISWTAMVSAYVRAGKLREARALFDRVDAKRNAVTWTSLLSGYVRSSRIPEAEELFNSMPDKNVVSWNTMISGYAADNGLIDKAYDLFERMPERNIVSWNTIVSALAHSGRVDEACRLFSIMSERDVISWTAMVAGLSQNGRVDEARELFNEMPERNVVSWNAMIAGYTQNSRLDEALELFERMPVRDIASWNAMITGFIQNGDLKRGKVLFDRTREKNVVTWTTLITGYSDDGQNEVALKVFVEMQRDGVHPNQGTFVSVLAAISNLAALQEGQQIHQLISKTVFQFCPFVESALISMYSKCGEVFTARNLFEGSKQKDLVSWNAMITAYAHHGYGKEAIQLGEEMKRNGLKPDDITFVGLLSACNHSGLVDEGIEIFESLVGDRSIEVREDHYACLVDLCGRAGRLQEAACFIKGLSIKPSSGCVWGALLSGCNVHGNENIGKLAARKLMEAEPNNAGTYMLLSNIYASAGKWNESAKIRLRMKDKGLKKQPGCSWIEVGNTVHVFVVRDKSHTETEVIYRLLQDLHHKMRMAGYAPALDSDEVMAV